MQNCSISSLSFYQKLKILENHAFWHSAMFLEFWSGYSLCGCAVARKNPKIDQSLWYYSTFLIKMLCKTKKPSHNGNLANRLWHPDNVALEANEDPIALI